jgi:hypothetical protein
MNQSRRKPVQAVVLPVVLGGLFTSMMHAQATTPPTGDPDAADRSAVPAVTTPPTPPAHDRLFFVLPNYVTVEKSANLPPLSAKEKLKLQVHASFDVAQFLWYGALAGISQASNTEAGYGQGASGYAKRYGQQFGDGTIEDFSTRVAFAAMLHQDPRYFRMAKGSFWHRAGYSVSRVVLTRGDSGRTQFNYSEVFGAAVAAGVSTYTYHPHGDRTLSTALSTWGTQVGYDCISNLLREFWPDMRRATHH